MERKPRYDIKSLEYTNKPVIVELAKGQKFYETEKSFEIWNENPLFRVKSIRKKSVCWVEIF